MGRDFANEHRPPKFTPPSKTAGPCPPLLEAQNDVLQSTNRHVADGRGFGHVRSVLIRQCGRPDAETLDRALHDRRCRSWDKAVRQKQAPGRHDAIYSTKNAAV